MTFGPSSRMLSEIKQKIADSSCIISESKQSCPELRERYAKSIHDDIEKGYVKKLSEEEVQCDSKMTWYLPHRFVINPKKPDRIRGVCDASAKLMGQSLNDKIYAGPDLLSVRSLPQVLRRKNCNGC